MGMVKNLLCCKEGGYRRLDKTQGLAGLHREAQSLPGFHTRS